MSSRPNLRDVGTELHQRLLAGDSLTVTNEIAEIFTPILCKSLRHQFFNIRDLDMVDSAVTDALIAYFAHPEHYSPNRAGLFTYLRLRAASILLNVLADEKRRHGTGQSVELQPVESVYEMEDDNPEDSLISREINEQVMQQLREILPDPLDQELASLMIDGVRETHPYAQKLGIVGHSPDDQARIVKRNKDRIKIAVKRKYKREDSSDEP